MTKAALDALAAQARKGILCVRSTRMATGRVGRNVLHLALLKPRSLAGVQRLFVGY
jgi:hypothetical protein